MWLIALLVTALILSPPVERLAHASQAGHMAQHMVLAFLLAPLLVKADVIPVVLNLVRRGGSLHLSALIAWLGFVFTMIFWHLPGPAAWASVNQAVDVGEQVCFLSSGILFWSMALKVRGRRILADELAILYCAGALAVTDLVGAVLTLSQRLLYRSDLCRAGSIGLTDLQDQQLAGLLMWIPGFLILLVFLAVLFPAWLKRRDQRPHLT